MATANLPDKPVQAPKPDRDPEGRMTFTAHLGELRTRMIRSLIAVGVGFVVCYIFSNQIIGALSEPLQGLSHLSSAPPAADGASESEATPTHGPVLPGGMVSLTPFEAFFVKMRISGYFGLAMAAPIVVYQICAFVFPGLTLTEKRVVRFMLIGGFSLALVGVGVAYFLILPAVLEAVVHWTPPGVNIMLRLSDTLAVVVKALLAFGLAFQMPMIVLVLVYLGLLTPASLKQHRKFAIIGIFVAAAVFTPPDPISMLLMAFPMLGLYEISILVSYLVVRQKSKSSSAAGN